MIEMKLTEKQVTVLFFLNRRKAREDIDGPLTAAEIGEAVFRHQPVKHGAREWAGSALKTLERKGMVEKLGTAFTGGRCWTITDLGRAALASEPKP